MALLLILNIYYFDGEGTAQFLVIGQLDDAAIARPNLTLVLDVLGQNQFYFLVGRDVCNPSLVHAQIHSIRVNLDVLAIPITKMQIDKNHDRQMAKN